MQLSVLKHQVQVVETKLYVQLFCIGCAPATNMNNFTKSTVMSILGVLQVALLCEMPPDAGPVEVARAGSLC